MELAEDTARERDRTDLRQIPRGAEDSRLTVELQAYKLYTLRAVVTGSKPEIDVVWRKTIWAENEMAGAFDMANGMLPTCTHTSMAPG